MSANIQDFYAWTQQQAKLLREGRFGELDLLPLVEEIEDMGNRYYDQLESRFELLFSHLLKWLYQPAYRGASWRLTIQEQRRKIPKLLRKNPGLKSSLADILADAYEDARKSAADETGLPLSTFPTQCPWLSEQALDSEFWPD
ncbi:MAG: DUF29 domain-containing protein [Proteobacteria bacterium]|nr:DUF29 domain-containing protein [Pseudomonadota bacterium]